MQRQHRWHEMQVGLAASQTNQLAVFFMHGSGVPERREGPFGVRASGRQAGRAGSAAGRLATATFHEACCQGGSTGYTSHSIHSTPAMSAPPKRYTLRVVERGPSISLRPSASFIRTSHRRARACESWVHESPRWPFSPSRSLPNGTWVPCCAAPGLSQFHR